VRSVKVTLAVGIAVVAGVVAFALTRSPPRVVAGSAHRTYAFLGKGNTDLGVCQAHETLPADVSAIRLSLWAFIGWDMHVVVYRGSRVLTAGKRGSNWTSESVTVPVSPLDHATSDATLCFTIAPNSEPAVLLGAEAPKQEAAVLFMHGKPSPTSPGEGRLPGRIGVEYLSAGRGSWWSRISSIAAHVGLGRAFSGTWIAFFIAALVAAVGILAVRLTLRELP
jgi:hypothetical protein